MSYVVKTVSSLVKVRSAADLARELPEKVTLLRGESFSFQIGISSEQAVFASVDAETDLGCEILTYAVRNVNMDRPAYADHDGDLLTDVPGPMPDLLEPAVPGRICVKADHFPAAFFAEFRVPEDAEAGTHVVRMRIGITGGDGSLIERVTKTLEIEVLASKLPGESVLFTEWFHVDCIAKKHHTGIYTEAHWEMIGKYMDAARHNGINMILTPVLTPPLDTMIGTSRAITQLIDIEKTGSGSDAFSFEFSRLARYLDMALERGFRAFEISHLFSQWGAKCAPNIVVKESGREKLMFGWEVPSTDPGYAAFLRVFLPALTDFLEEKKVLDRCYFHISDEPGLDALPMYRRLSALVKPYLKGRPIMDALSNVEFAGEGLIDCPVTATNHIEPFLSGHFEDQWAYVCCGQYKKVGNRFLSMPSRRNRILGVQMFKFGIRGFLQWGFNFYLSQLSVYEIDPYVTTSADGAFPSGDAFIVYPGADGPLNSIRGLVFRDALQDIRVLELAAEKCGREKILVLIDEMAGMNLRFDHYPSDDDYVPELIEKAKGMIRDAEGE